MLKGMGASLLPRPSPAHAGLSTGRGLDGAHGTLSNYTHVQGAVLRECEGKIMLPHAETTARARSTFSNNICAQCGAHLFAPDWSEYVNERRVRHAWSCDQ